VVAESSMLGDESLLGLTTLIRALTAGGSALARLD
jgi:hypothetical protein